MNQGQTELSNGLSNDVTVLVFKDNYAARTFRISLSWISRFGLLLGLLVGITLVSSTIAVKFYSASRHSVPGDLGHVQELEQEIATLRASLTDDQEKKSLSQATSNGKPFLFSAFPPQVAPNGADPATLPIAVRNSKVNWQGRTIAVHFDIQYVRDDRRNQQGKIILVARGPGILFTYPENILTRAGSDNLIDSDQGEYFSVSRIRAVDARFGPLKSFDAIKDIEYFIISDSGKVLIYDKLTVPPVPTARPNNRPAPHAAPQAIEVQKQIAVPANIPAIEASPAVSPPAVEGESE